jgi:hypothetical protein
MNVKCSKYRFIQHLKNCTGPNGCEIECVLLITKRLKMIKIQVSGNVISFSSVRNTGYS